VLTAGLAVGATLTPISVHRRVFGEHVKDRVVTAGHVFVQVVIGLLALIIVGICTLIFSVVRGWPDALVVAVVAAAVLGMLLIAVPLAVARRNARP
jgi:ABC-type molybdate transport system permease subunit